MTVSVKEQKQKLHRIQELGDRGFNIPKFFFLQANAPNSRLEDCMAWATKIHENKPTQIFNIRTYHHEKGIESLQTPHICDIKMQDLLSTILGYNKGLSCMVDAETPDNGRVAGNVYIERFRSFTIDYIAKDLRAMVRDANTNIQGEDFTKFIQPSPSDGDFQKSFEAEEVLIEVLSKAATFRDYILEWTYFSEPAGVKNENLVFWEYREYSPMIHSIS